MKVLAAVSGKTQAECPDPVEAVASFPWPAGSTVRVLSVAESVHPIPALLTAHRNAGAATAQDIAASVAADLQGRGFTAEGVWIEGDPTRAIAEHAGEWGAELIVVGASDRPPVEKFFLGSVSQAVVKRSSCSVPVVKSGPGGA
jgi:nucleotide-binding universal stress UspA family protein